MKWGLAHGKTDEYEYFAVEEEARSHNHHATMHHLLHLDHTRVTYRHAGRQFRLTDVYGEVGREILG